MKGVQVALVVIALAAVPAFSPPPAKAADALTLEEVSDVLCRPEFQWDCTWVVGRAWAESRFQPSAVNYDCDASGTYTVRCYGLLQLEEHHAPNGDTEALKDVWVNVYISYRLWLERGREPWGG